MEDELNKYVDYLGWVARTATPTPVDKLNRDCAGIAVLLNIATAPGGGANLTLAINGVDRQTEAYNSTNLTAYPTTWSLLTSDPIVAAGLYVFKVFPSAIPEPGVVANDILPRHFNISATHSNTASWLYAVSYFLGN